MDRVGKISFALVLTGLISAGIGLAISISDRSAQSQAPSVPARSVQFAGVVIAGGEFTPSRLPGRHGTDYIYPAASDIQYFASKGMNVIRVPVLWERLQRRLNVALDEAEMRRIDALIKTAETKQMKVILSVNNYASYAGSTIGGDKVSGEAFGDLWHQIATRYKNRESVAFGLMHSPVGLQTETWLTASNIAIAEIRRAGARNLILVAGNGWSSARDWAASYYGTPNSEVMLNSFDPGMNTVFEVQQNFDSDFSGTHADCRDAMVGVESLKSFTNWARKNRRRGFLSQFGVGTSETCLDALDNVLQFMADNNDVWLGWTYWAGGAWWPKDYYTNVSPLDGADRPQMKILEKHAAKNDELPLTR